MMAFYRLIWLMPAAFACHIAEEYIGGFPAWVTNVVGGSMSAPMFLINNAGFMAVLLALTAWSAIARTAAANAVLIAWASANLFWDFLFHVGTVPLFDRYSPGLITATLLYFPISVAVAWAALTQRVLSPRAFQISCAIGFVGMGFVIWAGLDHFAV
jgi:hypothetical protein